MQEIKNNETWESYSKLILNELQSLKAGQERLSDEVILLTNKITKIEQAEKFVQKMQEVATIEQYKQLYKDVGVLNRVKNNALVVFGLIQATVGLGLWLLTYLK
jgi:uncharacterized protein YlxW (UPF0749 family)